MTEHTRNDPSRGACSRTPRLVLDGVSKAFGPRTIFRKVALRLFPGCLYLLLGPNGAGKSTLLKIMAGLMRPDSGVVTWHLTPDKVAYMGHATFLYPGLSALENLLFWAGAAGLPQGGLKARDALRRVGLEAHAEDRAGVFSRGMAQRLNLARLLLGGPDLILLDEPGTGLDQRSRVLLRALVDEARGRGAVVVWISHDRKEDGALADSLLHLEGRTLREEKGEREPRTQASPDTGRTRETGERAEASLC